ASARLGRVELQCRPQLRGILLAWGELKAPGHDADNRALQPVEERLPADDPWITAEDILPGTVGDIRNGLDARQVVSRGNQAPLQGCNTERFEHAAAEVSGGHANRLRLACQVSAPGDPSVERSP